jgi:hypothetical protein
VDDSGMIRTQMGMHNRSVMVTVHGTPCVIQLRNSNSKSYITGERLLSPKKIMAATIVWL